MNEEQATNWIEWADKIREKLEKGERKFAIGLPLTDEKVYRHFMESFLVMEKPDFTLLNPNFPDSIDKMRNQLVMAAMMRGVTHLIMMDTDQIYPSDTIANLLRPDLPMVGTVVHRRYPPFDPILYRGQLHKYWHVPDDECYSGDLIEVAATGCGCVYYSMQCFLDVEYPWFEMDVQGASDVAPDEWQTVGEDIGFCYKLVDAGYKLYVDTACVIDHLTLMRINRETHEVFKHLRQFKWNGPPGDNEPVIMK